MDSINNEISTGATHEVSPRTVRTNWLQFAWSQVSGATKVLLILSITLSLIQIITTIVVLVIGGRNKLGCDKPLQLYLIIFVIRVGVSLPLSIYQHLFVTRQRRGRRRGPNNRINHNRSGVSTTETSTVPDTTAAPTDTQSTPPVTTDQPTQNQPASLISGWAERLKSLLDLFAILWFIVGNYLIFSSYICSANAALYYYTILTWILLGYTVLVVPLLACASVIFCLPCVLVTMRTFNINVSNVMKGGTKEELAKIPIYKYKAPVDSQQNTEPSEVTIVNTHPMKKANYFRKFMRRHHEDPIKKDHSSIPSLTIHKAEDAMCSICLSEYENDELISKLWCNHHYHHSCVTEWLALNTKCPLCKRDFRGKNHISEDLSDNEDEQV